MFKCGNSRFDLFVEKIFKTVISPRMSEDVFVVYEYKNNKTLTVKVFSKEHIILLKAVTERQNDFDDILNIAKKEKNRLAIPC